MEKSKDIIIKRFYQWLRFLKGKYLKYLIIFSTVCFLLTLGYMILSSYLPAGLDLNPEMPTETAATGDPTFLMAITLLPLTLLFEGFGLRLAPAIYIGFFLKSIDTTETRKWRWILFNNQRKIFLIVSSLCHTSLHQLNVVAADPLGRLAYFGVQLVIGYMLARIFVRKGFWESYTVHLSYDLLLIGFILLSSAWQIF